MKATLICLLFLWASNDVAYVYLRPTQDEVSYKKLNWSDFRLKTQSGDIVAESVTSIGYVFDGENKVSVCCRFYTKESFVTLKGRTEYILSHEQRHFDITYLHALLLVKRLAEQKELTGGKIEGIYQQVVVEKNAMQSRYDAETAHSQNKIMQKFWDEKIEKLLQ